MNTPNPVVNLLYNIREVYHLIEFHVEKTGIKPGRRYNVEILNKSAIVLMTACWEAYIEDVATQSFLFLINKVTTPEQLPAGIRKGVADMINKEKHELAMWKLAAEGWKSTLIAYKGEMLGNYLHKFHTPNIDNIDKLFKSLLDIDCISKKWSWHRMPSTKIKERLDKYITLRGSIAHRVAANKAVLKRDVHDYIWLIWNLSLKTHNAVSLHVEKIVGELPWGRIRGDIFKRILGASVRIAKIGTATGFQ